MYFQASLRTDRGGCWMHAIDNGATGQIFGSGNGGKTAAVFA
jgi:hypothetical protein